MQTGKPLLEINHLHTAFRIKDDYYDAVDDVSFTLEKNEILAIVGESGSGKSTLATTIVGLHNKANTRISGEVVYQDLNLIDLKKHNFNKLYIGNYTINDIVEGKIIENYFLILF